MASIADATANTARDALRRLGPDYVETRKVGNGLEYRINGNGVLASKDADLKSQLAAKDAEIAGLRSQLAAKDAEITKLKAELRTATAVQPDEKANRKSSPSKKSAGAAP